MSYSNPDNKDIMAAIDKLQRQLDEMKYQFDEMQKTHRLFSPEHIAEMMGYMHIRTDLDEIKKTVAALSQHIGVNKDS